MKIKQGNWVNRQELCLILSNCLANRMRCGNFLVVVVVRGFVNWYKGEAFIEEKRWTETGIGEMCKMNIGA